MGAPLADAPTDLDKRLSENIGRFGASLEEASRTRARDVDGALDYAVVDGTGQLRSAAGGIPLQTDSDSRGTDLTGSAKRAVNGAFYMGLSSPVVDRSGHPVGRIVVFRTVRLSAGSCATRCGLGLAVAITDGKAPCFFDLSNDFGIQWLARTSQLTQCTRLRSQLLQYDHAPDCGRSTQGSNSDFVENPQYVGRTEPRGIVKQRSLPLRSKARRSNSMRSSRTGRRPAPRCGRPAPGRPGSGFRFPCIDTRAVLLTLRRSDQRNASARAGGGGTGNGPPASQRESGGCPVSECSRTW